MFSRRPRRWATLLVLGILVGYYLNFRFKGTSFPVSQEFRCEVVRFPGRCSAKCFKGGAYIGEVALRDVLLSHPMAILPDSSQDSLLCLLELDTTLCAFTVELRSLVPDSESIPDRIDDACSSSNFKVRACRKGEVERALAFIQNADEATIRACVLARYTTEAEVRTGLQESLLSAVDYHFENARPHLRQEE